MRVELNDAATIVVVVNGEEKTIDPFVANNRIASCEADWEAIHIEVADILGVEASDLFRNQVYEFADVVTAVCAKLHEQLKKKRESMQSWQPTTRAYQTAGHNGERK